MPADLGKVPTEFGFGHNLHPTRHFFNMDKFAPSTSDRSRSGTPGTGRFTAQAETAEDLLKSQTVGLVHLDDFRKRRAEALEHKERGTSGASTPQDGYVSHSKRTALWG